MPLSEPAPREPIHTRCITLDGYRREDGLWDIEGRLTDAKHYEFRDPTRGTLQPGHPIHEMLIRLTLDSSFTVVAIEASTEQAPFGMCGAITPNFQRLVGERIGTGWTRRVKSLVGGIEGCAHHVELICVMGTAAWQTIGPMLGRGSGDGRVMLGRQFLVNTCHVWQEGGPVMRAHFPSETAGD